MHRHHQPAETTVVWDRSTGALIHHAIVWQDRRTSDYCAELKQRQNTVSDIQSKTGLLLTPISQRPNTLDLDNVPDARARADRGELAFGTVDSWLLWKLTGGKSHFTDATNASTMLNIRSQSWDEDLLSLFEVPASVLPEVRTVPQISAPPSLFGASIPITGMIGDQQSAAFDRAVFRKAWQKAPTAPAASCC